MAISRFSVNEESGLSGQSKGVFDVHDPRSIGIEADAHVGTAREGDLTFAVERQRAGPRLAEAHSVPRSEYAVIGHGHRRKQPRRDRRQYGPTSVADAHVQATARRRLDAE